MDKQSNAGAGQDEARIFGVPKNDIFKKKDGGMSKEHKNQPEEVPNGQTWNN